MMTRCQVTTGILAGATLSSTAVAAGTSGGDATLRSAGGMPLMAALKSVDIRPASIPSDRCRPWTFRTGSL